MAFVFSTRRVTQLTLGFVMASLIGSFNYFDSTLVQAQSRDPLQVVTTIW